MAEFGNDGQKLMDWSFDNPAARKAAEAALKPGQTLDRNVPARPGDYGAYSKRVTEYFAKGDPVAADLVEFELDAIGQYVKWFKSIGTESLAIVGGTGHSLMPQIRDRFGDMIVEEEPDSLYGAVFTARQLFADA
jgi:N-acetylglucosamine kinase-like BadF-type ATPase